MTFNCYYIWLNTILIVVNGKFLGAKVKGLFLTTK